MKLPTEVNILGIVHSIEYLEGASEVDIDKRTALWGQIDYWSRSIRVYVGHDRKADDIFQTIIHEVLHAIANQLHIEDLIGKDKEGNIDLLATGLADALLRNGWITFE